MSWKHSWIAVPPEFNNFTGSEELPYPFIWVCPLCGRYGTVRHEMGDSSCSTWAVLCWNTFKQRDLLHFFFKNQKRIRRISDNQNFIKGNTVTIPWFIIRDGDGDPVQTLHMREKW